MGHTFHLYDVCEYGSYLSSVWCMPVWVIPFICMMYASMGYTFYLYDVCEYGAIPFICMMYVSMGVPPSWVGGVQNRSANVGAQSITSALPQQPGISEQSSNNAFLVEQCVEVVDLYQICIDQELFYFIKFIIILIDRYYILYTSICTGA